MSRTEVSRNQVEDAVNCFEVRGFSCSQAIFSTYAESLGLNPEIALKIADAFRAGMGGMAETCGAVTGAFMVIGLKYGRTQADDTAAKEKTQALVKEFVKLFKKRRGVLTCKALLETDISTPDGMETAGKNGLFQTHCPTIIRDAAEILEQLL